MRLVDAHHMMCADNLAYNWFCQVLILFLKAS